MLLKWPYDNNPFDFPVVEIEVAKRIFLEEVFPLREDMRKQLRRSIMSQSSVKAKSSSKVPHLSILLFLAEIAQVDISGLVGLEIGHGAVFACLFCRFWGVAEQSDKIKMVNHLRNGIMDTQTLHSFYVELCAACQYSLAGFSVDLPAEGSATEKTPDMEIRKLRDVYQVEVKTIDYEAGMPFDCTRFALAVKKAILKHKLVAENKHIRLEYYGGRQPKNSKLEEDLSDVIARALAEGHAVGATFNAAVYRLDTNKDRRTFRETRNPKRVLTLHSPDARGCCVTVEMKPEQWALGKVIADRMSDAFDQLTKPIPGLIWMFVSLPADAKDLHIGLAGMMQFPEVKRKFLELQDGDARRLLAVHLSGLINVRRDGDGSHHIDFEVFAFSNRDSFEVGKYFALLAKHPTGQRIHATAPIVMHG